MNFKTLAIIALFTVFLYNMLLKLIRYRSAENPVPPNVVDVYDRDTYKKWRAYHAEKCRLGMLESAAGFAVDVLLILLNAYALFAGLFADTPFMQMFAVMLLSALTAVAALPFSYYDTMVIEEKYGFNRSTGKTFWLDQLKSFLIGLALTLLSMRRLGLRATPAWLGLLAFYVVIHAALRLGRAF